MRRDQLFLAEMIDAAEQAHRLTGETSVEDLSKDRQRRDALMWNFTVLGESLDSGLGRTEVPVQRCRVAAALPVAQPGSARVLDDRPRDPARHGYRLPARIHRLTAHRPARHRNRRRLRRLSRMP